MPKELKTTHIEDVIIKTLYLVSLHAFLLSTDFFQNQLFLKILSGTRSECQTVWIQIRPDILSGLIWVQTVCKSYQQTTLVGKDLSHTCNMIV